MAAFLDIEIALNNVNLESIHAFLVSWIHIMLKSRSINQGGTPNGGILSLFFSNSLRRKTNTSQLSPFLWKESWRNCRAWKNRKVSVWTREKTITSLYGWKLWKSSLIETNGKITSILNIYFCRSSEWGHSNILLDAKCQDNMIYHETKRKWSLDNPTGIVSVLALYTDRSKMEKGTGAGAYRDFLEIRKW